MTHAELVSALGRGDAYPTPPRTPITVTQTHISVLFFVGDRVYKVKKPLALDFLDYSTLERRRHFCEEEVRLNRRLARDVYLGVVAINRAEDGSIRVNGPGETVEYAVEMVRLPADRMMSALLDRGEIDNEHLDRIAKVLARFHAEAPTGPDVDAFGDPEELRREMEKNLHEIERPDILSERRRDHLLNVARLWLDEHAGLFAGRIRDGRIREGHGDLHAGNICLLPDGARIYDCIEFSQRFRCRDVACEMAFLAMDLDLRCLRGFASYLLQAYATLTDDPDLPRVAHFYKLHLAAVRGKVLAMQASDVDRSDDERATLRLESLRYFDLAATYAGGPALILMCGLPGSGKSHAARAIARPFEAIVIRSDVVRKKSAEAEQIMKDARPAPIDAGIYTPDFSERTYETMLAMVDRFAERAQTADRTVVVDATFATAARRQPFFEWAQTQGRPCILVEVRCPEEIIRERLLRRIDDPGEVSDADWRVYLHARERFEPPDEFPASCRARIESQRPDEEIATAVIDTLIDAR